VTLTVIDASHPPTTITKPGIVVTDVVKPSFTYTIAGNMVSFTDTSTPTPTSWAWDFDGDSVVDSTLQNPVFVAPDICAAYQVSLAASRACGPTATVREGVAVAPNALTTSLITTQGFFGTVGGNVFDVAVTNPLGINIGAITACPYTDGVLALGAPLTCELYVTTAPGGFNANHMNASVWRKVATGNGTYLGGNSASPRPVTFTLDRSAYLPNGSYGVAVYLLGSGMAFRTGTLTSGNGDLTITSGGAKTGVFNAAITATRPWCGTFHYDTAQTGGGAGYGYFGAGCPSSQALVSRQVVQSLPKLGGTLSVDMTNLPVDVGIVVVGLSNTLSAFGPLPIDVTPIGMNGCSLRASLDATVVVVGTGGTGNWSFAIPSAATLVGFQLFTQTLVFDAPANPFGCVLGDAHAALLGL
jgi:PKD repeat protein